jgi:hypothetical protein
MLVKHELPLKGEGKGSDAASKSDAKDITVPSPISLTVSELAKYRYV